MDNFRLLVKKFNVELNVSLQLDVLDVISPSKDNDGHATNVARDIPDDLDCSCYDHHDKMKIIALTCCKKKVHEICLEKLLENYAQ
jgi:hypothetical protein